MFSFLLQSNLEQKKQACYRQTCSAAGGKIDRAILSLGQAHSSKDGMKDDKLVTITAIPSTEQIFIQTTKCLHILKPN